MNLDTPSSTARERPVVVLASLRRRLAAMLYESLLLLGVIALGFLVPWGVVLGLWGQAGHSDSLLRMPAWVGQLELLHLIVLLGGYFVWLWRRNGQTLAMQTWGLQLVETQSGTKPSLRRCLLRYVLAWPSTLLVLSGLGILWAAFVDRDRQFLHDRLAGTVVVFNPRSQGGS